MVALVQVVLSSGKVNKLMKLVEVRGYSFTGTDINLHVSSTGLHALLTCHIQRFSAICEEGSYDAMASHCRASLGYKVRALLVTTIHQAITTNAIYSIEYECKEDNLLDLTIGSCR